MMLASELAYSFQEAKELYIQLCTERDAIQDTKLALTGSIEKYIGDWLYAEYDIKFKNIWGPIHATICDLNNDLVIINYNIEQLRIYGMKLQKT